MFLIDKASDQMSYIAVGLVQVALLEFLHHNVTLHFQALFIEVEGEHPVAFQPESRLHVLSRQGDVIVGDVVVRPGIVLASGVLHVSVVVGNVDGTAEHQVLEEVGKACVLGVLVPCPYIVEYIQRHHLRVLVLVVDDAETVRKGVSVYCNHSSFLHCHSEELWRRRISEA